MTRVSGRAWNRELLSMTMVRWPLKAQTLAMVALNVPGVVVMDAMCAAPSLRLPASQVLRKLHCGRVQIGAGTQVAQRVTE